MEQLYILLLAGVLLVAAGVVNACVQTHKGKMTAIGFAALAALANAAAVVTG